MSVAKWAACMAAMVVGTAADAAPEPATPRRPNVVVILADDLGYADLGCQQQSRDVRTPNIDTIATNGIRFTSGYVTCPVCGPSRAGLMTGRYQQRFGFEFNTSPNPPPTVGLPVEETTIAQALKGAGYATGVFGKWHLGFAQQFFPLKRGFDEFFGFLPAAHSYLSAELDTRPLYRGTQVTDEKEYLTDALTREAVNFIEKHHNEPFFVYLPYNAVHYPVEATEKYLSRFPDEKNEVRRGMLAMLSAEDDGVGRVLAKIREHNLEENTLIVFLSDNGGAPVRSGSLNTPLSGAKQQVWEGGIREPFLMQWKGHLPAGTVTDLPIISLDIFPTVLTAAGVDRATDAPQPLDGVNLLPFIKGEAKGEPHEYLYWRFGEQAAVRGGNWKLVMIKGAPDRLFDLSQDIGENKDVAAKHPHITQRLKSAWDKWNAQLVPSKWGGGNEGRAAAMARREFK